MDNALSIENKAREVFLSQVENIDLTDKEALAQAIAIAIRQSIEKYDSLTHHDNL